MSTHISLDIEACGEVLLSMGACHFDLMTGESGQVFYGVPSVQEQLDVGLKMDASAFLWLLKQPEAARRTIADEQGGAREVLEGFRTWFPKDAWLWAYPTSFDLPVVARVYAAFGMRPPWTWTKTLDGRTLWRLACVIDPALEKIEKEANPSPHHALADAREQARWFAKYLVPVLGQKVLA